MGRIRSSIIAGACAALLLGASSAAAQPADRSTFVTFSGPVTVPGTTLPAGTYTFRLADSPADRHIVQIFDKEQSKLFATVLAIAAERNEAEGEPVVTFRETPADMPPALRYWYYAGEKSGNEFVYPKAQAMTIARASGQGVMAIDTESTDIEEWKKGTPTRVSANAEPQTSTATSTATTTSTASTTTADPTTSAQPTTTAQPTATPPAATAPATPPPATTPPPMVSAPERPAPQSDRPVGTSGRPEPNELPRTASELPAVGFIAVFALAGALALRAARKSIA